MIEGRNSVSIVNILYLYLKPMVPKDLHLISRFILHCWSYFAIIST